MLYIIPPLSCPELCRRSKGRLGGDCDTPNSKLQTPNSLHPPLPPPFQEGAQFACHAIQVPPRSKGRLGGDGQPPRISRISTDNLSFKIRYVKIHVIRWRDSAANKKPLLSFGRICNPTVLSICIYYAKTMEPFDEVFFTTTN